MEENTKATQPVVPIDITPAGALKRTLMRLPQRTKVLWLLGFAGLTVIGSAIAATVIPSQTTTVSNNPQAAYDFITTDPAILAGVSANDAPEAALAKLYEVMPVFDAWLAEQVDRDIAALTTNESLRLLEVAKAEAASGEVVTADPVSDIDLQNCLVQMEAYQCVLLRYAGDGLQQFHAGSEERDVYEAMTGLIRYRAALIALYPVAQETPDIQSSLKGLANYRLSIYDIARLLPAALGPEVQFRAPLGETTPAEALEVTD
ncbi:hypothetical protein [Halomicronema sp. CCY15110]|uniref:hypothetical protein n=1 Tax=Halomicronema sp. CCY15110 TaxID=2767773 RepID=UPI00194DE49E|nr:hypothetical protein [Halomicronema sp. CCY15110]